MSHNIGKLQLSFIEEQIEMLQDQANRLRKALKANGEDVSDVAPAKKGKELGEKATRKPRGERKVTKKRALSAYQVFMKENLKSYKQRHPEMIQTEVLKVIATRWGKLSIEKKAEYQEQAKDLKEEFIATQHAEAEAAASGSDYQVVPVDSKNKKRKHDEKENDVVHSSSSNSAAILQSQVDEDEEGGKKKKKKKDKNQD